MYRFSPITSQAGLMDAITHVHFECYRLCKDSFGEYLANSGNIGIFCHYDDEYEYLTKVREGLTEASENLDQKYFKLYEPIVIPSQYGVPETTYTYLYIRKPDPYRHHVGDIDFYLPETEYTKLKSEIEQGRVVPGARIFPSPTLDMIELYNSDSDALGYVSTETMTDIVKTTKSET